MTDGLRQGARGLAAARDGDRCSAYVSEVGGTAHNAQTAPM
jgi:hypothetical protein